MVTVSAKVEYLQQKRYRQVLEKAQKAQKKQQIKPLCNEDIAWTCDNKCPKWWPHGGAGYARTPTITWGIPTPRRFLLDRYCR